MNLLHRWICGSALWRKVLRDKILPWVLSGVELGQHVLEVGPGSRLTTDLLCPRLERITAIEIDAALAHSLKRRVHGSSVAGVQGDATAMPFENNSFSGAVSFTMFHHVPSPALQDRLLREVYRVLKPGGIFVGTDSLSSPALQLIHIWDTLVPVDPATFGARLEAAGFTNVSIDVNKRAFRFSARRP